LEKKENPGLFFLKGGAPEKKEKLPPPVFLKGKKIP